MTARNLNFTFGTLVMAWGLAWPISKVGLDYMSPLWYSAFRFFIGLTVIVIYLAITKQLKLPSKRDLPFIFSLGLFQMSAFLMLLNYGLSYVGAGRAAILTYSTPIWVTPIAIVFFGEKLNRFKILGLILGIAGILTIFSPWSVDWNNDAVLFGNALLVLAAMVSAGVILHARFGTWHSSPIELLPWQMLIAGIVTCTTAFLLEPNAQRQWCGALVATLIYNGIAATAFGYWASIVIAKALPAVTTSIGFLGVPIVGLFSSAIFLGEELTVSLCGALVLIVGGLFAMTKGDMKVAR